MPRAALPKFYAVRRGRIPGIYKSWDECEEQVRGFPGCQHKSFRSIQEAQVYLEEGPLINLRPPSSSKHASSPSKRDLTKKKKARYFHQLVNTELVPSEQEQQQHQQEQQQQQQQQQQPLPLLLQEQSFALLEQQFTPATPDFSDRVQPGVVPSARSNGAVHATAAAAVHPGLNPGGGNETGAGGFVNGGAFASVVGFANSGIGFASGGESVNGAGFASVGGGGGSGFVSGNAVDNSGALAQLQLPSVNDARALSAFLPVQGNFQEGSLRVQGNGGEDALSALPDTVAPPCLPTQSSAAPFSAPWPNQEPSGNPPAIEPVRNSAQYSGARTLALAPPAVVTNAGLQITAMQNAVIHNAAMQNTPTQSTTMQSVAIQNTAMQNAMMQKPPTQNTATQEGVVMDVGLADFGRSLVAAAAAAWHEEVRKKKAQSRGKGGSAGLPNQLGEGGALPNAFSQFSHPPSLEPCTVVQQNWGGEGGDAVRGGFDMNRQGMEGGEYGGREDVDEETEDEGDEDEDKPIGQRGWKIERDVDEHAISLEQRLGADAVDALDSWWHCIDPRLEYRMEFHGAVKGNPAFGGAGVVLREPDGREMCSVCEGVGRTKCNHAEYRALMAGLKVAHGIGIRRLRVQGDSKLVVMQTQGVWKVGSDELVPFVKEAQELMAQFESISIHHIRREDNVKAEELSNLAIELPNGDRRIKPNIDSRQAQAQLQAPAVH